MVCLIRNDAGGLPNSSASPFRRVMAARRHAQHRHRGFDRFLAESRVQQAFEALGPRFWRGFANPVLDADNVVRVGIVAQQFDRAAGEGWRVAVLSCPAGKGSGPLPSSHLGLMPHRCSSSCWT